MKKTFLITLFISILFSNLFAGKIEEAEKTPFLTRSFPLPSITEIEANTCGGYIYLNGNAETEAIVEVYVSCDSKMSEEKIRKIIDENYTINIDVKNSKLQVSATQKKNFNSGNISISFKIFVAKEVKSNLTTNGSSIKIENLKGTHNITTSGGAITLDKVSGNVQGVTSGGSISVNHSSGTINILTSGGSINVNNSKDNITLTTSGGSIIARNCSNNINLTTSGGNISASNIEGTLKTSTSGGSIILTDIAGNLEAKTSGGSIDANMKSVTDYVTLSSNGNISLTLPANVNCHLDAKGNKLEFNVSRFKGKELVPLKSIEGCIGEGGAKVYVRGQKVWLEVKNE